MVVVVAPEWPDVSSPSLCHSPGPSLLLPSLLLLALPLLSPCPALLLAVLGADDSSAELTADSPSETAAWLEETSGSPQSSEAAPLAPRPPRLCGGEAVRVAETSSATGCSSTPTARRGTANETERLLPGLRPALPGAAGLLRPPARNVPLHVNPIRETSHGSHSALLCASTGATCYCPCVVLGDCQCSILS